MALFAGGRDASLIRKLNTELMRRWIDTEIEFYKLSMNDTQDNIYMESDSKKYFQPVKFHCTAQKDPREIAASEVGLDSNRLGVFSFIRNDLKDASIVIEIGDLIWWDGDYYEIDGITLDVKTVNKKYIITQKTCTEICTMDNDAAIHYIQNYIKIQI